MSTRTTVSKSADPYLEREQARYGKALPSREYILQILTAQGVPFSTEKLAQLAGVSTQDLPIFQRRLRAMERDGQIMRNRKNAICVVEKMDLVKGVVEGHPDGFGFLVPDSGGEHLYLGPTEMHKALHGDRVVARPKGLNRRGKREAAIVEVLERVNQQMVGRLRSEHGILLFAPEDKRINQDFLVLPRASLTAKAGQVVEAQIVEQPLGHAQALVRVVNVLGSHGDPGMEIEIALRKHRLPHEFSAVVRRICEKLPTKVLPEDYRDRRDIRALPLVTIDGENARDFDDAVYCEVQGKNFHLLVAIADVSHYVRANSALDQEAKLRGNSVYFPRRVIPMLPEALSNELCSLNPQAERLCMVCDMAIDARGGIRNYRFYPAVMRSAARLTYTQVAAGLADPKGKSARALGPLAAPLLDLYQLFKILQKARYRRGAIEFETLETLMVFDSAGKIERIDRQERNDAHRLIEECMLAANVCASDFLTRHHHPALYRIHAGPTLEKLAALQEFLKGFGFSLTGGKSPHAKDYAKLLERIRGRPDAQLLQTVMLRSLQQAVYSPENVGHFGLAYESYTHFTSPIRRYPDLVVHRSIKAVLKGKSHAPGSWVELGMHCSQTERRADEATRDVENWLKCYYMQDKVGKEFAATVSGVTSFGLFVALDDIYVEGLVHISELGSDYFHFDAAKHELLGERTAKRYRLGDRLRVTAVRVDMEYARIDFVLLSSGSVLRSKKTRSRTAPR